MPDSTFAESSPTIAELVRTERLQLLFRQSIVAVFGSYIAAVILCSLLWEVSSHELLIGWMVLQSVFTAARLWLFIAWHRAPPEQRVPRFWERPYWITLVLSAACWGLGAVLVMPRDSLLHQAYTLFIIVGMAGGAVSTYSAYRAMTLSAIALVMLPTTLWLLAQGSAIHIALALAALLFQVATVRSTRELSGAMETSFRLGHEMKAAHELAEQAVRTDELTGVASRRAFFERAQQLVNYCQRNKRSLCALVMDLDHYKQINDTWGHQVGDRVLQQVGNLLQETFRKADVCGRMGGEEFAALLVDTSVQAALQMAESLRADIAALVIEVGDARFVTVTASIGVAALGEGQYELNTLLQQADAAMYRAKSAGRNRVCGPESP